jgi:cell division protein FtsW
MSFLDYQADALNKKEHPIFKGDPVIWYIVAALSLISILVVYSATQSLAFKYLEGDTEYYLLKHARLVLLALLVMWIAHRIDYRYYARLSLFALWLSVPLLLIAQLYGTSINEASRWITIPFINQSFQPSDLAKLALISRLAAMLSKRQHRIEDIHEGLLPMLFWVGLICGLIGLSNFSNALILFMTSLLIMFIGRVPLRYFFTVLLIGAIALFIALSFGERAATVKSRIESYLNKEEVPFQAEQSYIAIATGGLTGKGPGNSTQRNILPNPFSDFIFAIIVEEYGLVGGAFVVFLYLGLLYRGMMILSRSHRAFGGLLAAGLSFSLVVQAMANMAVAVGLVPITGLPLPLISMGGTSLLFTGLAIGIILSVSRGDIVEQNNHN